MLDPSDVNCARAAGDSLLAISRCRYGALMYLRQDIYIGRSFAEYGEYSEGEVEQFRHWLRPGDVAVDIGANFGSHTCRWRGWSARPASSTRSSRSASCFRSCRATSRSTSCSTCAPCRLRSGAPSAASRRRRSTIARAIISAASRSTSNTRSTTKR